MKLAKRHALDTGRTLTQLIEDALRAALAEPAHAARHDPVVLPTFGSKGLLPGVDLDDTAALTDLMERDA
jgi:hypothetical protein